MSYLTRITGTLHEDQYTLLITRSPILLRIRNVSAKAVRKIKTYFVFSNFFLGNRAVYEIMWKNMLSPDRPQMTI
jgi:hypothetical protein